MPPTTKSLYESRWAIPLPTATNSSTTAKLKSPSPASAQELVRFLKIVSRLKWKLPFLAEGYRLATSHSGMAPDDISYAEIMFKIDFHEYYALLERAIVHLLAVWGIAVPNSRSYNAGNPSTSTNNTTSAGERWSSRHRYHANVLEILESTSCPLYEALGSGKTHDQLKRAKQLRNQWKTADSTEEDARNGFVAGLATQRDTAAKPLEGYDLEGIIVNIFNGLEKGHLLAQTFVSSGNPEMDIEVTPEGDAQGDWDFIVDAMDWEAV